MKGPCFSLIKHHISIYKDKVLSRDFVLFSLVEWNLTQSTSLTENVHVQFMVTFVCEDSVRGKKTKDLLSKRYYLSFPHTRQGLVLTLMAEMGRQIYPSNLQILKETGASVSSEEMKRRRK